MQPKIFKDLGLRVNVAATNTLKTKKHVVTD